MRKKTIYIEKEWMEGFRLGSEHSFSELFNQLYPALTLYSFRITKNQPASEDIAEESFLKVWNNRDSFQQYDHLKSWLYKVVKNSSLKWLKKEEKTLANNLQIIADYESSEKHALDALIQAEVFREIHTILGSLPSQSRKIAQMIFFEDKTIQEVSDELGLSASTVKTQKGRALAKLKKYLLYQLLLVLFSYH
jgi:RNA polymerase sigma-70 factor (ECF subfamily)